MADLPKHIAQLKEAEDVAKAIVRALYLGGRKIELHAEKSITEGSVSGKMHVPSRPGEPPNRDTGVLDSHIETRIVAQSPPEVHVESKAPYAAHLEFGTRKMAARPYMRPAAKAKSEEIAKAVGAAVRTHIVRVTNG